MYLLLLLLAQGFVVFETILMVGTYGVEWGLGQQATKANSLPVLFFVLLFLLLLSDPHAVDGLRCNNSPFYLSRNKGIQL